MKINENNKISFRKEYKEKHPEIIEIQHKINAIHEELFSILEDNNVTWFALGGTAIGAEIWGGHIPWDDDSDIAILSEDWYKIKDQISSSEKISLEKGSEFSQIIKIVSEGAFVDIVLFNNINKNKLKNKFLSIKLSFIQLASFKFLEKSVIPSKILLFLSYFLPIKREKLIKVREKINLKKRNGIFSPMTRADIKMGHWGTNNVKTKLVPFETYKIRVLRDNKKFIMTKYPKYEYVPEDRSPRHLEEHKKRQK